MPTYLALEGQNSATADGIYAGRSSLAELSLTGMSEAMNLGLEAERYGFESVVCSSAGRSLIAADIVCRTAGIDPSHVRGRRGFDEYDFGSLEGKPAPQKPIVSAHLVTTPGTENPMVFAGRVMRCLKENNDSKANILFIGQNCVTKMIKMIDRGRNPAEFYDTPPLRKGTIDQIDVVDLSRKFHDLFTRYNGTT